MCLSVCCQPQIQEHLTDSLLSGHFHVFLQSSHQNSLTVVVFQHVCSMFVVQVEDTERREKNLEEAKKIVIEKDPSLPDPEAVRLSHFSFYSISISKLVLIACFCKKTPKRFI